MDELRSAVDQPPHGGSDYPFVGASTLADHILDAYLSYPDPDLTVRWPLRLVVTPTDVTVHDANNAIVVTAPWTAAAVTPWGSREIRRWVVGSTVLRLVVRPPIGTGEAVLDARTYHRRPDRLESLAVAGDTAPDPRLQGQVVWEAGYNVVLTDLGDTTDASGRTITSVQIDVIPGAGQGRAPGCLEPETPPVRSINRIPPTDDGRFLLSVDSCLRLTSSGSSGLRLASDCSPCCPCDYFVRVYEGMRKVAERWQDVLDQAQAIRDQYHTNRQRWEDARKCRAANAVRVNVTPLGRCRFGITVAFCNLSASCLSPLELRVRLQLTGPGTGLQIESGFMIGSHTDGHETAYRPGQQTVDGQPVFVFSVPYLDPQHTVTAGVRLHIPNCSTATVVRVQAAAHADLTHISDLEPVGPGTPFGSAWPILATDELSTVLDPAAPGYC